MWLDNAVRLLEKSLYPVPIELNELDWKSDLSPNTQRLAKHISAFANQTGGGYLVFGINNDGTAIDLSSEQMNAIIQTLGNIARNNVEPPVTIDHESFDFEGNSILFINIPEQSEKPVYIRGTDIYDSYKRSAGQTVKLSKSDVKKLIALSSGLTFEKQIAKRSLSKKNVLDSLNYEKYYLLQGRRKPSNDNSDEILRDLTNDGLISQNTQGNWDIHNLGAILFANDLNQFETLSRKAVRVISYKETSRINAIMNRDGHKGYVLGFEPLITYVTNQLPSNEIIKDALRITTEVYPKVALREFIANALIHQDFDITGTGILIEIFTDRIEITNPGPPLIDINRFIDSAPRSRNESLASLMRRLNICEERGSGIDRAIDAIESYQLPAPKFERGEDYTRVTLYAPLQQLSRMGKEDRIRACYQHTVLHYVSNQPVNNTSIRERFNIPKNSYTIASNIISETIEEGLIKASDPSNTSNKKATYIPFWA